MGWRTRWPAAGLLAFALAWWVVGVATIVPDLHDGSAEQWGTPYGSLLQSAAALSFPIVGFIARRHPVGRLLLGAGVLIQVFGAADGLGWTEVSKVAAAAAAVLVLIGVPLLFPDGRPLSTFWRWYGRSSIPVIAAALVWTPALIPFALLCAGTTVSLGTRYRRGGEAERQQVRWLALSVGYVVVSLVALAVAGHFLPRPLPLWFRIVIDLANLLIAAVPVSIGFAVLRYRLWLIDLFADRTLVLLGVGGFTGAVYVAVVAGLGAVVGGQADVWLLILATVLVALTVQPVRRRVETAAHRLVYGRGTDPYDVLTDFSRQIAGRDPDAGALRECAHAAAVVTGAGRAYAYVRLGDDWQPAARWPDNAPDRAFADDRATVLVEQRGVLLGAVSVVRDGELSPRRRRLLEDLGAQAAMLFRGVALTTDLRRRLAELERSRRRILSAEDTARRQIERDLHDGAQQRLVTLGISLHRLRTRLDGDDRLLELLDGASADLRAALGELRELARGIHPALLTEAGVADAVRALIERSPVRAELTGAPRQRFPAAIETAAYYVVAEALVNVAKHAPAAAVCVELAGDERKLVVRVTDTGPGGADPEKGTGLRGLSDRVTSVGGTFSVRSETGTEILAELPCD